MQSGQAPPSSGAHGPFLVLPSMERLQWYRVKLSYKNTQLTLAVDDRVLVQTRDVEQRTFTAVQFMSPQRIFLDDIEMWGMVQD